MFISYYASVSLIDLRLVLCPFVQLLPCDFNFFPRALSAGRFFVGELESRQMQGLARCSLFLIIVVPLYKTGRSPTGKHNGCHCNEDSHDQT